MARPAAYALASGYKRERVPCVLRQQLTGKGAPACRFEESSRLPGQFGKDGMTSYPAEPISGIAVVRFTAMHDAVYERAILVIGVLSERMGGVAVVVPEQDQSPEQGLSRGHGVMISEESGERRLQLVCGTGPAAWSRAQVRRLIRCQERQ